MHIVYVAHHIYICTTNKLFQCYGLILVISVVSMESLVSPEPKIAHIL